MAHHLEPAEVAGYGTFGQVCEIGGVLVKVDTVGRNKYFIRLAGPLERLPPRRLVRHRRGRRIDNPPELS